MQFCPLQSKFIEAFKLINFDIIRLYPKQTFKIYFKLIHSHLKKATLTSNLRKMIFECKLRRFFAFKIAPYTYLSTITFGLVIER